MSDQPTVNLKTLLEESGLLDRAECIDDDLYRLQEGSAMVVVGIKGRALVIISPMFKGLPAGKQAEFCFALLQINSTLGGIASFAIQPDGWIVIHGGRDVTGMDSDEFKMLISAVAKAADHYDNVLLDQFYTEVEASAEMTDADGESAEAADADAAADAAPDADADASADSDA